MGDLLKFKQPKPEKELIHFHCLECGKEWEDESYQCNCPDCDEFVEVEIVRRKS